MPCHTGLFCYVCFALSVVKRWNAPLGYLPSTSFCVAAANTTAEDTSDRMRAACILIPFTVPDEVAREHCSHTLQAVVGGRTLKSRSESGVH